MIIKYLVIPSFNKPWEEVIIYKGLSDIKRKRLIDIEVSPMSLLSEMKLEFTTGKSVDKIITQDEFLELFEIIRFARVELLNILDDPIGMDGTLRQLSIQTGMRTISIRWWESEYGTWDILAKIQNWFERS